MVLWQARDIGNFAGGVAGYSRGPRCSGTLLEQASHEPCSSARWDTMITGFNILLNAIH
jgi:hypothetical protein